MVDGKRIAKNTMFLYIRMLLLMLISLYTSRVILDVLGIEDYGLFNVVGGVVGVFSFISGTLSFGVSRYITYELGTNNIKKLKSTFSTSLIANILVGLLLVVLLDTLGLWFFYNKLTISPERLSAAFVVYQISLITMLMGFVQIPYRAVIIAHEKMGVYAYIAIFEAIGLLAICYLIATGPFDKLINYSLFLAVVQFITSFYYIFYCVKRFDETKNLLEFDKTILKDILRFSGWNVSANISEALNINGIVIIMNMFFAPALVGAQAFANKIATTIMLFVSNFRIAIDPQVIKLYAKGDKEASKRLTLRSAVYTFDVILLLALPCIFHMETILDLWLVEVPAYAVIFAQWTVAQKIPSAIDGTFFTPMVASGKIKRNAIYSLIVKTLSLIALYVVFRMGGDVMWVQYIGMFSAIFYSFFVKSYILYKDVEYNATELFGCLWQCTKVLIPSLVIAILIFNLTGEETLWNSLLSFILIAINVLINSLVFMDKADRSSLFSMMKRKLVAIKERMSTIS